MDMELLRGALGSISVRVGQGTFILVQAERGEGGFSSYSAPGICTVTLDGNIPPEGDTPVLGH